MCGCMLMSDVHTLVNSQNINGIVKVLVQKKRNISKRPSHAEYNSTFKYKGIMGFSNISLSLSHTHTHTNEHIKSR